MKRYTGLDLNIRQCAKTDKNLNDGQFSKSVDQMRTKVERLKWKTNMSQSCHRSFSKSTISTFNYCPCFYEFHVKVYSRHVNVKATTKFGFDVCHHSVNSIIIEILAKSLSLLHFIGVNGPLPRYRLRYKINTASICALFTSMIPHLHQSKANVREKFRVRLV